MSAPRALVAAALLVASGCRGSSPPEGPPAAKPSPPATPPADSLDGAPAASAAPRADDGLPRLAIVLDDPRLAAARSLEPPAAARVVEAAAPGAGLDGAGASSWWYVAGRLHALAGETAEAEAAFGKSVASAPGTDLAGYAALRQAEALVHLGRGVDARVVVGSVPDGIAARDEARLTLADAHVAAGERAKAVPLWRAQLAAAPHGLRWADTSLELAAALLDGVDALPRDAAAREALDLATRVLVDAPGVAEKADVAKLRERAATATHAPGPPALTPDERSRQAQAWLDAGQPRRAAEVADALLASLGARADPGTRAAACLAATVRAQSTPHGKSSAAADAWGVAIARCDGSDALPQALYYGAKASVSAHRHDEALARFGRVERDFPAHRLADDARLRSAMVVRDDGDLARARTMLATLPDAYPEGDMRGEALLRVAIEQLVARDLAGARATLDRALAIPEDAKGCCAGRAAYFRGRVDQMAGDAAAAKGRYASLVEGQPLSYYMLLASARLNALDPAAVHAGIQAATEREPAGPFLSGSKPELDSPSFARFARLLEVGDLDAARREASAGKLVGDGVDPEVLWIVAWAYDRAGAPDLGHSFSRSRLTDFRAHWPAGRWRLPWEVAYPRAWDGLVTRESSASGIPSPLTWSIMREESAYNPEAKSGAGALGLMQLMLGTARSIAQGTTVDEASLKRPETSITLGARLLGKMRASFQANPALAVAAYNCGSAPVRRWLGERGGDDFDLFVEQIPYEETRNYVKRVLTSEVAYAYLYAPAALDELLGLPERAAGRP